MADRVPVWDNTRWLMLLLVVYGHLLNDFKHPSNLQHWLALTIYSFHIPVLIFLSGYFAPGDLRKIGTLVWRLLAPYLFFEVVWAIIHRVVKGDLPGPNFIVIPDWTLWYLVTLASLALLGPVVLMTARPLLLSIAISILVVLLPGVGPQFSAERTFYYLPFFVAGTLCRRGKWLEKPWFTTPTVRLRIVAASAFVLIAAVFAVFVEPLEHLKARTWVAGYLPARSLLSPIGHSDWWGLPARAATLTAGAVMVIAVLLLVPRKHLAISRWGSRTLYIYLLHTFIVRVILDANWFGNLSGSPRWAVAVSALLAVVITVLLSTAVVKRFTRFAVEPPIGILLRRR